MSRCFRDLKRLNGMTVKRWWEWLNDVQQGCCHLEYAQDDKYVYSVCMGWLGDMIAWKIGRQSHNNAMQCDFDIDFEMPYNEESGEVDDTTAFLGDEFDWKEVAKDMKREAKRVAEAWIEKEKT